MAKNSKKIGSQYERDISRIISKWVTGDDDKLICWRHPGSGSVATNQIKKGKSGENVDGDIFCLDSDYEDFFDTFYIDGKSLTKIDLLIVNTKNQKSNKLLVNWKKVVNDARKVNKSPMMLVKVRDNRKIPDFVMFKEKIRLVEYSTKISFELNEKEYDCVLLLQDEFFMKNNWRNFVDVNKEKF